jgi:hypothetical protein
VLLRRPDAGAIQDRCSQPQRHRGPHVTTPCRLVADYSLGLLKR